ncbi:pyridoxamine 5'-phosphate oxidase family protein [Caulobacter soli]|uniref:pyridoxamine 5'-phosphate oxidase family protein n=1 Tax=Caulobacter soli TaxID=2708539 RepID=UPI0013ED4266|nr:pyridoxamine 5'-phosphate oxidase family protein [Caulobacter soli]
MDGPFHRGELIAQVLAGTGTPGFTGIRPFMPDQHRDFFALLPYLFIATTDAEGWPVATVLTGQPGFIRSPDPTTLTVAALPRAGEPGAELFAAGRPFGALGLDFATHRRNRVNGLIAGAGEGGLTLEVLQSFGNCPQYIQTRAVEAGPASTTPAEVIAFPTAEALAQIARADTMFVATNAGPEKSGGENGGVDISHRGGLPGFVKVAGNVLTIPDFRGNRFFNTLGNLVLDPRAGLLFVDFETGDLLHLQGRVEIDWTPTDDDLIQRQWRLTVEHAWRRPAALPLRWTFGAYSPVTLNTAAWNAAA